MSILGDQHASLPSLPSWTSAPDDQGEAIRQVKQAIRARLVAAGTSVEEVFATVEERIAARAAEIQAVEAAGESAWTVVDYADIANGTVSAEITDHLRSSGCLVVRGHFKHDQARRWDGALVEYVESNDFLTAYRGAGDSFFQSVDSLPAIFPIYWSPPQMEARQSEPMAAVQAFLNRQWNFDGQGQSWFDPDRQAMYPDRIRRRPPGTDSNGLGTHIDTGTLDLWMGSTYQNAFRHIFGGSIDQYDPWDASFRTAGAQFDGSTMCSAFRTFQGWTALSDMDRDQGVLRSVPIPGAMAYLLLRPLLADVADDDLCGVKLNRVFPITKAHHPLLREAFSRIPDVRAGDSVWWHCDVVHGVESVEQQQGWGNVMYIPAAPWCERNERYAASLSDSFLTGSSPTDFPNEHYERDWSNRFQLDQLNHIGRQALALG